MIIIGETVVGEILDQGLPPVLPPPPHPFPRPQSLRDRLDRILAGPPGRHRRR